MWRTSPDNGVEATRVILRGALGGTMIAHGLRHGKTLEGTARWFESIGFRQPTLQARLSSLVEVGSGAALAAGAVTPVSAAAVVGTMSVAYRTVHRPNGYFVVSEGWEYVGLISAAALALSALGPGRLSIDRVLGIDTIANGVGRATLAAGLGLAGAAVQLRAFWSQPELTAH